MNALRAIVERARAALAARGVWLANAISSPCPECHRQLRADGGCTHCERARLLEGPVKKISVNQAKSVLSEPVTVDNPTGARFRFTKERLLSDDGHLAADHSPADFARRARVLLYGLDAARTSSAVTNSRATRPNAMGVYPRRKEIRKRYADKETGERFDVVVRADDSGDVFDVFDLFPGKKIPATTRPSRVRLKGDDA